MQRFCGGAFLEPMETKKDSVNVLLWTDSDRFAGTERHCLDLAVGLQDSGVRVGLCCRPGTPLFEKAAREEVRLIEMDAQRGAVAAVSRLSRLFETGAADLLHVHNGRCALLARLALARVRRGTLVATQHFIAPARTRRRGLASAVSHRVHRWVDRGVSRWISISGAVRDAMVRRGDTSAEKVRLVFNGIKSPSSEEPSPPEARALLGFQEGVPVLFCAARLEPEKGHALLLDAFGMLRRQGVDFLAVFAGEGSQEEEIRRRILERRLSGHVRLVGQQPDIGLWLRASDVLVLPSPEEPFGLVLVEAMCRGVPAVAAAAGGPLEILEDGSGLLFAPGDVRDLALKLRRIFTEPELRSGLGGAGLRRWAARFNVETMARSMWTVYQEAVAEAAVHGTSRG